MTDLRGELLSRLMSEKSVQAFFAFLERGNWLIFQDAYPQFLIYEESKRQKRSLFYLLPYLNISVFMEVIWKHFWMERDCYKLAIALIVNEQSYLEKRIVQNPIYKDKVFQTLEFVLQDILPSTIFCFPLTRMKGWRSLDKRFITLDHYMSELCLGRDCTAYCSKIKGN